MDTAEDSSAGPVLAGEHYAHFGAWDIDLPPLGLPDMLRQAVEAAPGAPLIDFLGRTFSYRQIWEEARAFAAGAQRLGLG